MRPGLERSVAAEAPEPVAQVGDPAQRPLGAGALHDEVAGEAAVGAAVPVLVVEVGRRRVGRLVPGPRRGPGSRAPAGCGRPGRARRRAPPPRRARRPPGSAGSARRPSGRSRRWWRRTSRRAGRAWRPGGSRRHRRRPCPGRGRRRGPRGPGPGRRSSRPAPAARAGRRRRRPAPSPRRRRPRSAPAPGTTARRRRWTTSARSPSRRAGRTAGTGRRSPTRRSTPSRWSGRGGRAACSAAAARCPGARRRAASRPGVGHLEAVPAQRGEQVGAGVGVEVGASRSRRTSSASSSSSRGRAPRGGRGPSRSVSSGSWTSTRHGTPAYVISAAASAPADSAATSSPSRVASAEAAIAASWRASSRSARRCSAVSSALKRAGSVGSPAAAGPSSASSPASSRASTAGARRSRRWHSRRSWQRATRTPAASSGGYQRAVSSQTHRGRVRGLALTDVRRQVGERRAPARRRPRSPARGRPGRRERWTRAMGTLAHTTDGRRGCRAGRSAPCGRPTTARSSTTPTSRPKRFVIEKRVIDTIRHTPKGATIRIAVYSFDRMPVADALVARTGAGCEVQMLLNDHQDTAAMKGVRAAIGTNRHAKNFIYKCFEGCRGTAERVQQPALEVVHVHPGREVDRRDGPRLGQPDAQRRPAPVERRLLHVRQPRAVHAVHRPGSRT